jgi:D-alanyl-lipoteichoic acid acyltransferase DltB (MBOAT superfamily)
VLSDPQTFLLFSLLTVALYWLVPHAHSRARGILLIVCSCVFIGSVSPASLAACTAMSLVAWSAARALQSAESRAITWSATLAILLLLVLANLSGSARIFPAGLLIHLGLSYAALRSISVIADANGGRRKQVTAPFLDVFLLNSFFPAYSAGPIERLEAFRPERLSARFELDAFVRGVFRILIGFFKVSFVAGLLIDPFLGSRYPDFFSEASAYGAVDAHVYVWLALLSIYFNFSGYSDIAIGVAAMLGLTLRENFDRPFAATNLQDFWRRWHVSMMNFSFRYVYFPLIKRTRGKIELSIFVTFVLIGLWHELSWTFLCWGAAHGAGLALVAWFGRKVKGGQALRKRLPYRLVQWYLTLFFVAWAWSFALSGSVANGLRMTLRLTGM